MTEDKTLGKFIEPRANLVQVGRKFDGCDCIVVDKTDEELIVELCDYHTKTVKEGSIKHLCIWVEPAQPFNFERHD